MLTEQLFSGSQTISKKKFRKKILEHKLPLTREDCHLIMNELDRSKICQITAKAFLNFINKGPKAAWIPGQAEQQHKQISQNDTNFLLQQANKKIQELEFEIQQKENINIDPVLPLKLKSAEEELENFKCKLNYCLTENEKLKLDKQRLEIHISKQNSSIGASEYLAIQRKIEIIEESHYRREQEMKNRMNGISYRSGQEIEEVKQKYEAEKNMLQKVILKKSEEINEFKAELGELLNEIEQLRSKHKPQTAQW